MKNSKTIIGFINTTIKGYKHVFGEITEERAHKIITSIIGDMRYGDPVTNEVIEKMKEFYNYKG